MADGFSPNCDLALSGNILYGTAYGGGQLDEGTIYSVTPTDRISPRC